MAFMCWLCVSISLLLGSASAVASQEAKSRKIELFGFPEIESYTLENGLEVFLWPDPSAKLVGGNIWYRSGSLQEAPGITGIAHLFEHMMFRPSRLAPKGGLELASGWAADANATTKFKTTNYTFYMPADKISEYLQFEADRMSHLSLNATLLANEKEAVRSEYLNWDNSPMMLMLPILAKALFQNHIAGSFVTGERADLNKITAEHCIAFYKANYVPNNAALILTGNFQPATVKPIIEKHFGALKAGKPIANPKDVASWPAAIVIKQDVPGKSHFLSVAYPIPFYREPSPGLALGIHMLFSGKRSLVGRELIVNKKFATDVNYDVDGLGWPVVMVSLVKGEDVDNALKVLDLVVSTAGSLSAEQLQRYAIDYQAAVLRSLQSPDQRARTLGTYLNYKDGVSGLQRDLHAAKAISLSDVKAALDQYVRSNNRVAVYGHPKG